MRIIMLNSRMLKDKIIAHNRIVKHLLAIRDLRPINKSTIRGVSDVNLKALIEEERELVKLYKSRLKSHLHIKKNGFSFKNRGSNTKELKFLS